MTCWNAENFDKQELICNLFLPQLNFEKWYKDFNLRKSNRNEINGIAYGFSLLPAYEESIACILTSLKCILRIFWTQKFHFVGCLCIRECCHSTLMVCMCAKCVLSPRFHSFSSYLINIHYLVCTLEIMCALEWCECIFWNTLCKLQICWDIHHQRILSTHMRALHNKNRQQEQQHFVQFGIMYLQVTNICLNAVASVVVIIATTTPRHAMHCSLVLLNRHIR